MSTYGPTVGDGSRVAVLGGGPAGSFFACLALRLAERLDLRLEVDVYEPRSFTASGPAGCNMCGGIVSESLLQMLAYEGFEIPPGVVQRGLEAYVLHTGDGSVRIATPFGEKRIASLHRGGGPRDVGERRWVGFDQHLLETAVARGARLVAGRVTAVTHAAGGLAVTGPGGERIYDLLVGACGVNSNAFDLLAPLLDSRPPRTARAYITELLLGTEAVSRSFGTAMHVFFSGELAGIDFAAIIPKGDYATVCLLGPAIDSSVVAAFFASPMVRALFPAATEPGPGACRCSPKINVGQASHPFADRLVLVGDCAVTRLYKDGLGAAYKTAKAAARTAVLRGVGAEDFRRHYLPLVRSIARDNRVGHGLFAAAAVARGVPPVLRAAVRMAAREQELAPRERRMSTVFWDLFTGSASYRSTLGRMLHPRFLARLAGELLAGRRRPRPTAEVGGV